MRFNLTEIEFHNLGINNTYKLVQFKEDEMIFQFNNATGNFGWKYQYITDPPLLADIGEFDMDIENVTFKIDFNSDFKDDMIEVDINKVELDIKPWNFSMEGISDISELETNAFNYIGSVVTNRLQSIVNKTDLTKISNFVNTLIEMIPDEKDIPGTELYVEGGISDNFKISEKDQYVLLPLSLSLQNRSVPYHMERDVQFTQYKNHD